MGRGSNFARGIGEGFLEEVTDLGLFKTLRDEPSTYAGQIVLPGQWEKQRLHETKWLGDEGGIEDESGTDPAFVVSGF